MVFVHLPSFHTFAFRDIYNFFANYNEHNEQIYIPHSAWKLAFVSFLRRMKMRQFVRFSNTVQKLHITTSHSNSLTYTIRLYRPFPNWILWHLEMTETKWIWDFQSSNMIYLSKYEFSRCCIYLINNLIFSELSSLYKTITKVFNTRSSIENISLKWVFFMFQILTYLLIVFPLSPTSITLSLRWYRISLIFWLMPRKNSRVVGTL